MKVNIEDIKLHESIIFDFFLNYCECEKLIRDNFPSVLRYTPINILDYAKKYNFGLSKDMGIDITKLKKKFPSDYTIIDEIFNLKLNRPSCRKIRNKIIHGSISNDDFEYFVSNSDFLIDCLIKFNENIKAFVKAY